MKKIYKSLLTVMMITAIVGSFFTGCNNNVSQNTDSSSVNISDSSSDASSEMSSSVISISSSLSSSVSSQSVLSSLTISKSKSSSKTSSLKTSSTSVVPKPAVTLKLATTTSVNDSSLIDYLKPFLKAEENISLDVLAQGSGQAIKTASDGNCDILIAHSPAAEVEFVNSGVGVERKQFMYNYFAIAGPIADPAGVKIATGAATAFTKIYNKSNCTFYSRDDKSGTDTKEKSIWSSVGFDVTKFSTAFYNKTGKGMLATLTMADNMDGYTLTDKATFLANKDKLTHLALLYEKNEELKNIYSVTLISKVKYPNLKYDAAKIFHDWLLKPSTQKRIADYGKAQYGEALFYIS